MIVVKLQGGLGNQLFQYAVGKRLSLYYNTILKLDTSFFSNQTLNETRGVTLRKYELDQLNIAAEIASGADIKRFVNSGSALQRLLKFLTHSKYIAEKSFRFDDEFLSYGKNCYLDGYWQSESYFDAISDVLKNEFTQKAKPDAINTVMAAKINAVPSVSIHVRRGDYIHNAAAQKFHGICSEEYYQQAIKLVAAKIAEPHFFIFSDDINWVVDNFKTGFPSTIVDVNGSNGAVSDMYLMSMCNHHIIANSSFSWWGAWLGDDKDKIVVAPRKWFADISVDTATVLPENWYKL